MKTIPRTSGGILAWGLVAVALNIPCFADSMSMQLSPSNPKFTYRLTADNRIVLPEAVQVRFSRSDQDILCNKVVEVGAYTSGVSMVTNNAAPGTTDPYKILFTSPISGGAALCNFNYNDNLIILKPDAGTDRGFSEWFDEWKNPLSENYYKKRRVKQSLPLTFTRDYNFKIFIRKNGGAYEWRTPAIASATVKDKGGYFGIPYELIIDPIPNTPPRIDNLTLSPSPLPASGVPVKISLITNDDLGVKAVNVTAAAGSAAPKSFVLTSNGVPLGKTSDGRIISLWEGTYYPDPNTSISNRKITFTFKVSDEEGAVSNPAGEIRQIDQIGTPDVLAPKIETVAITPQTFPSTGGNVTVSARASDNAGIVSVRLDLTLPDGQIRPMTMAFVSGSCPVNGQCTSGEWKSSWTMWANTGNTPAAYNVKVTVTDAGKNSVSSASLPITVAGVPATAIRPPSSGAAVKPGPVTPKLPLATPPPPIP